MYDSCYLIRAKVKKNIGIGFVVRKGKRNEQGNTRFNFEVPVLPL
jgi:hypothetical protein